MVASFQSFEPHPPIGISDGTLAQARRQLDFEFRVRDWVTLGRALDAAGVDEFEIPVPELGSPGIDAARALHAALKRTRAVAHCRMLPEDVDAAVQGGFECVHLCEHHPRSALPEGQRLAIDRMQRVIAHARERGVSVHVGGEDSSRAGLGLVCQVLVAAEEAGARRFRFADSAGVMDPFSCYAVFRRLCAETDLELEFRGRNDLGLATANTLAAVRGGATHVSVCALPSAARADAAALDEVVLALSQIEGIHTRVDAAELPALLDLAAGLSGRSRRISRPALLMRRRLARGDA